MVGSIKAVGFAVGWWALCTLMVFVGASSVERLRGLMEIALKGYRGEEALVDGRCLAEGWIGVGDWRSAFQNPFPLFSVVL